MYIIYLDENIIYYPGDPVCTVMDPCIELTLNEAGSCEFRLPPENPYYDSILIRQSMIRVTRDGVDVFRGEVRECKKDKNKIKNVYAVGELSFFHNTRQPQVEYGEVTPFIFLKKVIEAHNEQVEARQQFEIGNVTITNGLNPISFFTDHNDSLEAIRTMLIDNLGGVLRIRKSGAHRYLDYISLAEYGSYNTQGVTFGENLMDYAEASSANDVVTAIIPRGSVIEDDSSQLDKHVDITSVNNGKDYLVNTNAKDAFGYIWEVVDFDGIDTPSDLKTAGQQYLTDHQYDDLELSLTAADLSQMDNSFSAFGLGDRVLVTAPPYGMSKVFPVKSLTLYPQAPQNELLQLSANIRRKSTYTSAASAHVAAASATAKKDDLTVRQIIKQEMEALVAKFTGSAGGYKLSEYDPNTGLWLRDLYMDAPDKSQATNIMQISMAGIAFSTNGYNGPYNSAWEINGKFYADYIIAGTLMAALLKAGILSDVQGNVSWNLETGAMTAKNLSIDSTNFDLDSAGNLEANNATFHGATIDGGEIVSENGTGANKETLRIAQAFIEGKRGNTQIGYLDLSADTGQSGQVEYNAVIGSKNILREEFVTQIDFVDMRTNTRVAYIDGNGYHGPIDANYLP